MDIDQVHRRKGGKVAEQWSQDDMKRFLSGGHVPRPNVSQTIDTKPKRAGRYGVKKTAGKMTKTEAAFAEILRARKDAGEILAWGYEDTRLRIIDATETAKAAYYTPDFRYVTSDFVTHFIEVKVPATENEATTLRIKSAAARYWPARFTMAILDKGEWSYKDFS